MNNDDKYNALIQSLASIESERSRRAKERAALANLSDAELRDLALRTLRGDVASAMRARTLAAEREAQSRTPAHAATKRDSGLAEWERDRKERRKRIAKENAERNRQQTEEAKLAGYDSPLALAVARTEAAIQNWTEHIRMEWTRELLGSDFALRDGTRVTWGAATLEQHTERRAMFADNARANLEGAARHEIAIQELTTSGARNLNAMVRGQRKAVA